MGYLDLVLVLVVLIDQESRHHPVSQLVLAEHAVDRIFDDFARILGDLIFQFDGSHSSRISAVTVIDFLVHLVPGRPYEVRIDDYHDISAVHIGSEINLVLAAKDQGDFCRHPSQRFRLGVEKMIFSLDCLLCHIFLECSEDFPDRRPAQIQYV